MVGGYGSAKTVSACVLGVLLSETVPGNIGLVARRSYSKLHDSTERSFLDVLNRRGIEYTAYDTHGGWPHRIVLKNTESEVHFRETKDLGRFLGPEYGWFYLDEAGEEPRKTFTDLIGRLRLPHARQFHKGFITTNPPHHQHWIAETFGLAPGIRESRDAETGQVTKYRLIRVSTRQNPFLPADYIADLKANNPDSEVKRIIDGDYGFTYDGQPVLAPPFAFNRHVMQIERPPITVVRSWDFGYHCPVVTWHQFPRCRSKAVHWLISHEYGGRDIEAEDLAHVVLDESAATFPNHARTAFVDCGDHAGAQINDRGPGPVIRLQKPPFNLRIKHRPIANVDPGLALMREAMRNQCACGMPTMQIDRSCRHVIDACAGGYHYPQFSSTPGRQQTERHLKPAKDGFYDNFIDSVRYCGENYYRSLVRDPELLDSLMRDNGGPGLMNNVAPSWAWMEAS